MYRERPSVVASSNGNVFVPCKILRKYSAMVRAALFVRILETPMSKKKYQASDY